MRNMREEYFENYQKVQVPAGNRRGFKTQYRYTGQWYDWDLEPSERKRRKAVFLGAEALSVLVYICAALISCRFNTLRFSSGLAVLSLVPWIAELWGVFRLLTVHGRMTVSDFNDIKNCITIGCSVRTAVLGAAVFSGIFLMFSQGGWDMASAAAAAGHLVSCAVSGFIFRGYTSLSYQLYNNN